MQPRNIAWDEHQEAPVILDPTRIIFWGIRIRGLQEAGILWSQGKERDKVRSLKKKTSKPTSGEERKFNKVNEPESTRTS